MRKLIPMKKYVLEIIQDSQDYNTGHKAIKSLEKIKNYTDFLSMPLTLGMFVPCDKDGKVLLGKPKSPAPDSEWIRWENEEFDYYRAMDNIIFEDWSYDVELQQIYYKNPKVLFNIEALPYYDIEMLTRKFEINLLTITEQAIDNYSI